MRFKFFTNLLFLISTSLFGQNHLILQPGPNDGVDVLLSSLDADTNYGDHSSFYAKAGTRDGSAVIGRSLIKFDLSKIDKSRVIEAAYLDLSYSFEDNDNPPHRGINNGFLYPITSSWDEHTVTWNTQPNYSFSNAVALRSSSFPEESYIGINVTDLVKRGVQNLSNYYGWLFKLDSEVLYTDLKFASSDTPNPYLRPKLTIIYACKITNVLNTSHDNGFIMRPGNGYVEFDFNNADVLYLSLFGVDGRNISNIPMKGFKTYKLNLNDLNKGIYYAVLQGSNFEETFKISN